MEELERVIDSLSALDTAVNALKMTLTYPLAEILDLPEPDIIDREEYDYEDVKEPPAKSGFYKIVAKIGDRFEEDITAYFDSPKCSWKVDPSWKVIAFKHIPAED